MTTLRPINRDDVRAMIIRHQGWDPGDLDPSRIRPLSEKAKRHPMMRLLPVDVGMFRELADEPGLGR